MLQRLKRWVRPDDLPSDPADLRIYHVPRTQTMEEQLLTARRVQDSIDDGKRVLPCAVCACYVGRGAVAEESCPLADIPAWQLLDANLPATLEMPRHVVTLVHNGAVSLCLSPEGITSPPGQQPVCVRVCTTCWTSLSAKKPAVPPRSLVRVDTGPWPTDQLGALPQPTYVERLLLSSVVPSCKVVVMRPTHGGAPGGMQKRELTGHVVVVPSTCVERLDAMLLPRNLEDLPDMLTVRGAPRVDA